MKDFNWTGLMVYANRGRWIAECECRSATQVTPEVKRWQCIECGARWSLLWPGRRVEIEAVLRPRRVVNQNWWPVETVEDLLAENIEHGITPEPV